MCVACSVSLMGNIHREILRKTDSKALHGVVVIEVWLSELMMQIFGVFSSFLFSTVLKLVYVLHLRLSNFQHAIYLN